MRIGFSFTVILACGILAGDVVLPAEPGQPKPASAAASKGKKPRVAAATRKFGERADALLAAAPANKGEWGLLIADAETGETLYELNADKYFVPASAGQVRTRLSLSHYVGNTRHGFAGRSVERRFVPCGSR